MSFICFLPWLDCKVFDYGNWFYLIAAGALLACICLYRGALKKNPNKDFAVLDNETNSLDIYQKAFKALRESANESAEYQSYDLVDILESEIEVSNLSVILFAKYYFGI